MNYDYTKVKKICEENLANQIFKYSHGMNLPNNFYSIIFEGICSIFKACPPEMIHAPFSLYLNNEFILPDGLKIYYTNELKDIEYKNANIVILDKNRFVVIYDEINTNGKDVFKYSFEGKQNEYFELNSNRVKIGDYIDPIMFSVFSCPTYADIDEALAIYYKEKARYSLCYIIETAWIDKTRQVLKEKPEGYFQKSLSQFLTTYLRGYTVKREQTVDDSHPVDIKATGPDLNTVSLIEIKWIGDSEKVRYHDARANEGAQQLIGYLNESEIREPNVNFKGYLTVFDARRKKDRKNYYDTKEIKYKQEYLDHDKLDLKRFFLCE